MSQTRLYSSTILAAVKPCLREFGFTQKSSKFTLDVSSDVKVQVWFMTVRAIVDGCLELRPHVYVYSALFAKLGRQCDGPPEWFMSCIEIPLTRLLNPEKICDALVEDPSLHIARSFVVHKWCAQFREATGGAPLQPADVSANLEQESRMLESFRDIAKKMDERTGG